MPNAVRLAPLLGLPGEGMPPVVLKKENAVGESPGAWSRTGLRLETLNGGGEVPEVLGESEAVGARNGVAEIAESARAEDTVPFKTALKLTPAQAQRFQEENLRRIEELQCEVGLTPQSAVVPGSWMWLRWCHEQYYQGDLEWRLAFGGIFSRSNFTLGSGLRHVRYNAARVQDDLLGTSPFCAALAARPESEKLARQVEEYIQGELERSAVRQGLREAQKIALYRNECVVKTGYVSESTPYVGEATVLVDGVSGRPLRTREKGRHIHEDDDFVAHPEVPGWMVLEEDPSFVVAPHPQPGWLRVIEGAEDEAARSGEASRAEGQWGTAAKGHGKGLPEDDRSAERAGVNPARRLARFQYIAELEQQLVTREGPYAEPLDYRSFLCPLKVKDIHEADTVVHLYLDTPSRINAVYGGIDVAQRYFSWWDRPGQDKPKYEQGEQEQPTTEVHQQIVIAEVYRRCDPDETGREKETLTVIDYTNRKTIYFNYLANHMPRRPFAVVPGVERIAGRWYGRGIYGMLQNHLLYEDAELNRANHKNSMDATVQFAYKDAVQAWKDGQPPMIGTGDTHWVNPGWSPEGGKRIIWRENLYENVTTDIQMMNTMRQSADALVGAISAQSANQSDFNQSRTATGNQLVQQASDVITKAMEQDQAAAITEALEQVVEVILERMDRQVMHANPRTGELATLNRNECRRLGRQVRLLLTRSKSSQLLNTSAQALVIAKDYHALREAAPAMARTLRPLYISQLKGLEVEEADALCAEVTEEEVAAHAQAQQQAAGVPVEADSQTI